MADSIEAPVADTELQCTLIHYANIFFNFSRKKSIWTKILKTLQQQSPQNNHDIKETL